MERFSPGDVIAVRGHRLGAFRTAKAVIVVEDSPDMLRYWWPAGTTHVVTTGMTQPREHMLPFTLDELQRGEWELTTMPWYTTDVLASTEPGSWIVTWHLWDAESGEFVYWYVDLKRPHMRTPVGFDTYDLDLDVVVEPNGAWQWKDRDEFDIRYEHGLITDHEHQAVEAAGLEAVARIERRDPPFDGSLVGWSPDPSWARPVIPDGWDGPPPA